jgi:hypothetical protein
MNAILNEIIEARQGHYTHAVEVGNVYELEAIAEAIIQENEESHSKEVIIDFLSSLSVYYYTEGEEDKEEEEKVYNFSFSDYIKDTI